MAMTLQYTKKLNFIGIINRDVTWDKKQCNLTRGQLASSVVFSAFTDVRFPLYQISQNFREMDTAFLFSPGIQNNDFTYDALAYTCWIKYMLLAVVIYLVKSLPMVIVLLIFRFISPFRYDIYFAVWGL